MFYECDRCGERDASDRRVATVHFRLCPKCANEWDDLCYGAVEVLQELNVANDVARFRLRNGPMHEYLEARREEDAAQVRARTFAKEWMAKGAKRGDDVQPDARVYLEER